MFITKWFWRTVNASALPIAAIAVLISMALTVWVVQDNRNLTQCVDRWATQYVAVANERANAHDIVQKALDALIRAVPTANRPGASATFEHALSAYIAASDTEQLSEKQHPLPMPPALEC